MKKEILDFKKKVLIFVIGLILILTFGCTGEIKESARLPRVPEGSKFVGSKTCGDCHDEIYSQFKDTIHGRLADFEVMGKKGCESCHGPGSLHVDEGDPSKIINFSKLSSEEISSICLKCHKKDEEIMDWWDSMHAKTGESCISCHVVHKEEKVVINHRSPAEIERASVSTVNLKEPEPELCYKCHGDIKTLVGYPSHHPIKERKMKCTDCHNVHSGVANSLRTEERLNDLCFKCHSDKQGPFTFEHEPVTEDCTICHEPHGTVANNLLKVNEPFLCLQCHHVHFQINHHKDVAMTAAQRCTQCHTQIHGSDYPSMTLTGGGDSLTR